MTTIKKEYNPMEDEKTEYTLDEWVEIMCNELKDYADTFRDQNDYHKQKHTWLEWGNTFGRYMSW